MLLFLCVCLRGSLARLTQVHRQGKAGSAPSMLQRHELFLCQLERRTTKKKSNVQGYKTNEFFFLPTER